MKELIGSRGRGGGAGVGAAARRCGAGRGGEVLAQHLPLQRAQRRRRVQAQLIGKAGAQAGEGGEGVALPAGRHQRPHQHVDRALAQRLRRHQRLRGRNRLPGTPDRDQGGGVLLGRGRPQGLEPSDLRLQRRVVELEERAPSPQRQRGGQPVRSRRPVRDSLGEWSMNAAASTTRRSASSR
jgi:hypothetical protein